MQTAVWLKMPEEEVVMTFPAYLPVRQPQLQLVHRPLSHARRDIIATMWEEEVVGLTAGLLGFAQVLRNLTATAAFPAEALTDAPGAEQVVILI